LTSLEVLSALADARANRAPVGNVRTGEDPLFALVSDEVRVREPRGIARLWVQGAAGVKRLSSWRRARANDVRAAFLLEWYRELRRHVADDRLPLDLRGRLRRSAHRSFTRWADADRRRAETPFPRTLLRDPVRGRFPEALLEEARRQAAHRGIPTGSFVAIDLRAPVDDLPGVLRAIEARGCTTVRLGQTPLVDVFILLTSVFLLCDNTDAQHTAYLTNTPTLTINATDAFRYYPVRTSGIYLLQAAVDLETGRTLSPAAMLEESYYRNLRNHGFRDNSGAEVRAAVDEMFDGVRDGWRETAAQSRYRARVVEAGAALAPSVRQVATWGPDHGFIGDGRIARVQADANA
jgi:hypothetical protein